jgi:hypothetical protein
MKNRFLLGALLGVLVPSFTFGATLTGVPMQGMMAMPEVAYRTNDARIHVMMPVDVPALTPLLVSNPADNFDPLDPWFSALDPSVQGLSFSRRYGFVISMMGTDPLPPGTQMWIRKLSGPADLKFYRYNGSAPKEFTPIFGTAGATNALYWDQMMFHPAVTAPPGTNSYAATFEVYLYDTVSGQDVPGSSSGPLEFNFTNLDDGRPELGLAPKMFVAWPSGTAPNWVLESAPAPFATNWTSVTNTPVTVDGQPGVVLDSSATQQYFRMRYVP